MLNSSDSAHELSELSPHFIGKPVYYVNEQVICHEVEESSSAATIPPSPTGIPPVFITLNYAYPNVALKFTVYQNIAQKTAIAIKYAMINLNAISFCSSPLRIEIKSGSILQHFLEGCQVSSILDPLFTDLEEGSEEIHDEHVGYRRRKGDPHVLES